MFEVMFDEGDIAVGVQGDLERSEMTKDSLLKFLTWAHVRAADYDNLLDSPEPSVPGGYRVDWKAGDSPFSTPLGSVQTIAMAGPVSAMRLSNGDVVLYDGGIMFNHSKFMRGFILGVQSAVNSA